MNIYLSMNGDTKVHYGYDLAFRTKQILDGTLRDGTGQTCGTICFGIERAGTELLLCRLLATGLVQDGSSLSIISSLLHDLTRLRIK